MVRRGPTSLGRAGWWPSLRASDQGDGGVARRGAAGSNAVVAGLVAAAAGVVLAVTTLTGTTDAPPKAPAGVEREAPLVAAEAAAEPTTEPEAAEHEAEPEPVPAGVAPLTGVTVTDQVAAELATRPALLVKIPNDVGARPQTGLDHADVVYEQETEGGITRFVAVFHSDLPEVVGNVRSARLVDPAIVAPYRGVMAFSGGRDEVRAAIASAGLATVTEGGAGFFRDGARSSPHNLYLRPHAALASQTAAPAAAAPWTFDPEPPAGGAALDGRLAVPVSRSATVGWTYDAAAGLFRRDQDGTHHAMTGGGAIGAANVVLLDVAVTGRDGHGAPLYDLTGTRDATLLRDGRSYAIRWSKAGRDEPIELLDGPDPAVLKPGPTWVVLTYDVAPPG
jgi:hypothetical protein